MSIKNLKICYLFANKKAVPKINISGEWLKKAGFEIGQNVTLEIVKNKIIIKNAD